MAESKSAQQVREITDKLEQGIKDLFESEKFKEYLTTMSKFITIPSITRCLSQCKSRMLLSLPVIPLGNETLTVRS